MSAARLDMIGSRMHAAIACNWNPVAMHAFVPALMWRGIIVEHFRPLLSVILLAATISHELMGTAWSFSRYAPIQCHGHFLCVPSGGEGIGVNALVLSARQRTAQVAAWHAVSLA